VTHEGTGADSAGVPWAGRSFQANTHSNDDGSAPEALIEAVRRFRAAELGEPEVVAAFRDARLLIPLVAVAGDEGVGAHGLAVDKTQELSIVTVAGPDGRAVVPVFSSVEAMGRWNPAARPVPANGVRVALAAASEQTELVVLDPGSPTEHVIRRPALWALAQQRPWTPSWLDEQLLRAFLDGAAPEPAVAAVTLASGDPSGRMAGPELVVQVAVHPGLDESGLAALLQRLSAGWAADPLVLERVDSMRLRVVAAP
jgi:hypothetical protein